MQGTRGQKMGQQPQYGDAQHGNVYRPDHPKLKGCAAYIVTDGANREIERVGEAYDDAPRVRLVRKHRRALGRELQKKAAQRRAVLRASGS